MAINGSVPVNPGKGNGLAVPYGDAEPQLTIIGKATEGYKVRSTKYVKRHCRTKE